MSGIHLRLRRISHQGRYVLVPMDHGVSIGPAPGLAPAKTTIAAVGRGGATGIIIHKGLVPDYTEANTEAGLLVHVSASTMTAPDLNDKRIVGTSSEVLALGADAISVHINVGSLTEADQLEDLGDVTRTAHELGLPVLAMMYPRGPEVSDPFDPDRVAHAIRLGQELGADVVKTVYTGKVDSFRDAVAGVSIPVLVAGGERMDTERSVLDLVHDAMEAGAHGISMGRNVFQHPHPGTMTRALAAIIHDNASADDAQKILKAAA